MTEQRDDLVATHFLEEINQIIAEIDGVPSTPPVEAVPVPPVASATAPAPQAATRPEVEEAIEPVQDLREHAVRRQVQNWWLSPPENPTYSLDPEHIIGAVVRTQRGGTSPITAYDPSTRRVLTRTGSVYELGMPEAIFAAKGRLVLRRLGI